MGGGDGIWMLGGREREGVKGEGGKGDKGY
jgi:hypothetical protein